MKASAPAQTPPPARALPTAAGRGLPLGALVLGAGAFHLAWWQPSGAACLPLFVFALLRLAESRSSRRAFYSALALGLAVYAPPLAFFWGIFGPPALVLWTILAAWLGVFVLLCRAVRAHLGCGAAAATAPFLWIGVEYFRSELYPLRFSWLSLGYAFSESPGVLQATGLGVYGLGFVVAALAAAGTCASGWRRGLTLGCGVLVLSLALQLPTPSDSRPPGAPTVPVAGLQLEYPCEDDLLRGLGRLAEGAPGARLVVLSEYSLQRPPPLEVLAWCRTNGRHLVVGGKDPIEDRRFRNTAFVVDPQGQVVFRQGKSVPIQFFDDGVAAAVRRPWDSPWGPVGLPICYDLSYRRVTDDFVRQGVQAFVVPTADDSSWGHREHALHARVARVRAAEYGLPVFRVAGSGISQLVDRRGRDQGAAPFPGPGEILKGSLELAGPGRLPLDVWLAPAGVGLAALTALGALGPFHWLRGLRRRDDGRASSPISNP